MLPMSFYTRRGILVLATGSKFFGDKSPMAGTFGRMMASLQMAVAMYTTVQPVPAPRRWRPS